MTIADASEEIQQYNVRRLTIKGVDFYKDSLLFGESFQESNLSLILQQLNNEDDPTNDELVQLELDYETKRQQLAEKHRLQLEEFSQTESDPPTELQKAQRRLLTLEHRLAEQELEKQALNSSMRECQKHMGKVMASKKKAIVVAQKVKTLLFVLLVVNLQLILCFIFAHTV